MKGRASKKDEGWSFDEEEQEDEQERFYYGFFQYI